jgi:hypothetical protein
LAAAPPGPTATPTVRARFEFGRIAFLAALLALACFAALGSFILRARGANPAVSTESVIKPASTDDSKPEISSVTPILPQARQRIVIQGRGLGLQFPTPAPILPTWRFGMTLLIGRQGASFLTTGTRLCWTSKAGPTTRS